jgi:phospholipid/cholesterol/gamma-HCH transport system substrate-binding protein
MGRETRVGALVLAALVIASTTILTLGRQQHLWERKVGYVLHFTRTNGLQPGAPVSLSGLPIGSVDELHFATEADAAHIEVAVRVDARVAGRIRTDTRATLRTLGLLGDKYIELVPGTDPDADAIPVGGVIPSVDPTDYEAVFGQSGDIVTNVVEVSAALKDVLGTIQRGEGLLGAMVRNREFGDRTLENLESTLTNIRATSAKLDRILDHVERGSGPLGVLVRDAELAKSIDRSIRALEKTTRRFATGEGAAMRLVDDRAYADRVLGALERTATNLASVSEKLDRGDGTLGKLINDPELHDEAEGLVRDVRSSWLVRLYEALRGLWPVGGGRPPEAGR